MITAVMVIIMISVDVVQDQGNRDWARGLTLCLYSAALSLLAAISQAIAVRFFEQNEVQEFSPVPEKKIIPVFQVHLGINEDRRLFFF